MNGGNRITKETLKTNDFDLVHRRRNCVFYSDNGGFQATDENNKAVPSLYFMGIIDILTPYDIKKKSEHFIKAMTQNKNEISAVKPSIYGNRFMKFMAKTLEHHEDVPREYQLDTNEKKLNWRFT